MTEPDKPWAESIPNLWQWQWGVHGQKRPSYAPWCPAQDGASSPSPPPPPGLNVCMWPPPKALCPHRHLKFNFLRRGGEDAGGRRDPPQSGRLAQGPGHNIQHVAWAAWAAQWPAGGWALWWASLPPSLPSSNTHPLTVYYTLHQPGHTNNTTPTHPPPSHCPNQHLEANNKWRKYPTFHDQKQDQCAIIRKLSSIINEMACFTEKEFQIAPVISFDFQAFICSLCSDKLNNWQLCFDSVKQRR